MKPNFTITLLVAVFIAVGFVVIFGLSNFIEKIRPPLPEGYIDNDLALQGEKLKGYVFGFEGLIADWYWMRSLQYVGKKVAQSKENIINIENLRTLNPKLLYPLLNNATTLDPKFMEVYSYGAVVLPAIDEKQAIKIVEKGIKHNPDDWRLYHYLGYIYWRLKEYKKAAKVYEEGSKIDSAPNWIKLLAAKMRSEGGGRETARIIYRQMLEEAKNTQTKENARKRILQLDSMDERDALNAALRRFKKKTSRCINEWREIFSDLRSVRLPGGRDFLINKDRKIVDPSGAPYLIDKKDCVAKLDAGKTKIILY